MDTDINNFGRKSLVTWTTGLKERIIEKEIRMKEMKFRAWDIEANTYVEIGFDFRIDGNGNIYRRVWGETVWDRTTNLILEQFTGLKDKKRTKEYPEGQEIYEGDKCKSGNGRLWEVKFGEFLYVGNTVPTIGWYMFGEAGPCYLPLNKDNSETFEIMEQGNG